MSLDLTLQQYLTYSIKGLVNRTNQNINYYSSPKLEISYINALISDIQNNLNSGYKNYLYNYYCEYGQGREDNPFSYSYGNYRTGGVLMMDYRADSSGFINYWRRGEQVSDYDFSAYRTGYTPSTQTSGESYNNLPISNYKIVVNAAPLYHLFPDPSKISYIYWHKNPQWYSSGQEKYYNYTTETSSNASFIADWYEEHKNWIINADIINDGGSSQYNNKMIKCYSGDTELTYNLQLNVPNTELVTHIQNLGLYLTPRTILPICFNLLNTYSNETTGFMGMYQPWTPLNHFDWFSLANLINDVGDKTEVLNRIDNEDNYYERTGRFVSYSQITNNANYLVTIIYDGVTYSFYRIEKETLEDVLDIIVPGKWLYTGFYEPNKLASLDIDYGGTLSPTFDPSVTEYNLLANNQNIIFSTTTTNDAALTVKRRDSSGLSYVVSSDDGVLDEYHFLMQYQSETLYFIVEENEWIVHIRLNDLYTPGTPPGQESTPGEVHNEWGTGTTYNDSVLEPNPNAVVNFGGKGSGYHIYLLTADQINYLKKNLWELPGTDAVKVLFANLSANGQAIINTTLFPFDLTYGKTLGTDYESAEVESGTGNSIWVGNYPFGWNSSQLGTVYEAKSSYNPFLETFTFTIDRYYGTANSENFLDYNPYTKITIYLPYIGFKNLDPNRIYGKTIYVRYAVNITNGNCICYLWNYKNNNIEEQYKEYIDIFEGNCGSNVPFYVNAANADYIKQLEKIGVSIAGAAITGGLGAGVAGKNIGNGALMGAANDVSGKLPYDEQFLPVKSLVGNPNLYRYLTQWIFILISRPKTDVPMSGYNSYQYYEGRPSNIVVAPNTLRGYTQISKPKLLNVGTIEEKEELINICENGIRIAALDSNNNLIY